MRTRDQVSREKLRGGFYSPEVLVDKCLARAAELLGDRADLTVLEPSAGDGAFLAGLARAPFKEKLTSVTAIELLSEESAKAEHALSSAAIAGEILNQNVLAWYATDTRNFDLALLNPPYVRFQFISESDKRRAKSICSELGVETSSVSNLWISVFLLSIAKLKVGGVFSAILPTEFLTGISAAAVRSWLIRNSSEITVDLFESGSFPAVLQEVLVISGRKDEYSPRNESSVRFVEHKGETKSWNHQIKVGSRTWTSYLLTPEQNLVLCDARSLITFRPLREVARFSVSTVTGANSYFSVPSTILDTYDLHPWAIPMLPRTRHAAGMVYTDEDAHGLDHDGLPVWMLDFSADRPDPMEHDGARRYLQLGIDEDLHSRYKCRIRAPWYRVPIVNPGTLLLSKRSNKIPRVISNHAKAATTDTIYRGQLLAGAEVSADDFTTTFHNSLTLLTCEIEGRSFGGGVLELVPSEVGSVLIPVLPGVASHLPELDNLARHSKDPFALVEATNRLIAREVPDLSEAALTSLADAHVELMHRRLERTQY